MPELISQPEILLLLAVVAMLAGFLDTLAGGGGLIVIPALMLAGVPALQAIATNKLQGSFGTFVAASTMLRKGIVSFRSVRTGFLFALGGSAIGAVVIQVIPAGTVTVVTPLVLVTIALYFLLSGRSGESERPARVSPRVFDCLASPLIGFYDGAFGPGAGSFYTLGGVVLRGRTLVQATAHAKVLNFASNLAALFIFIVGGKILWIVGGTMVAGTIIGAYLGSLVVIHRGARVIRPVIVFMSLAMLAVFAWRTWLS